MPALAPNLPGYNKPKPPTYLKFGQTDVPEDNYRGMMRPGYQEMEIRGYVSSMCGIGRFGPPSPP